LLADELLAGGEPAEETQPKTSEGGGPATGVCHGDGSGRWLAVGVVKLYRIARGKTRLQRSRVLEEVRRLVRHQAARRRGGGERSVVGRASRQLSVYAPQPGHGRDSTA